MAILQEDWELGRVNKLHFSKLSNGIMKNGDGTVHLEGVLIRVEFAFG